MEQQLELLEQAGLTWQHASGLDLTIRESARAKTLILQVAPPGIIEVVVPRGTRPKDVQDFVDQNWSWIKKASDSLDLLSTPSREPLPTEIDLVAVAHCLVVRYEFGATQTDRWYESGDELVVSVARESELTARHILGQWLMHQARSHLKAWLLREADRLEVNPRGIQVRRQRTRWGSCSTLGNISLNAALMLIPPDLVRYLLVHELVHLTHLNHSKRFWRRVARFEPHYRELDNRISQAWSDLPDWPFKGRRCQ